MFADYIPSTKGQDSFRVEYKDLDVALIDALIIEINSIEVPA
jgi:hypothetical protein